MKKTLKKSKGFTLAELLIVVAIIAVLVAISIPVFTSQLEKAKESTDAANIRSAYAEVVSKSLTDPNNTHSASVNLTQTNTSGWISSVTIAGVSASSLTSSPVTIEYNKTSQEITIGGQKASSGYSVS